MAIARRTCVTSVAADDVTSACVYTERERELACDSIVLTSPRGCPTTHSASQLRARGDEPGPDVRAIGDAWSPGTIAAAVWEGHRYAEELDEPPSNGDQPPFQREVIELANDG